MPDTAKKLSPAEFLAELTSQNDGNAYTAEVAEAMPDAFAGNLRSKNDFEENDFEESEDDFELTLPHTEESLKSQDLDNDPEEDSSADDIEYVKSGRGGISQKRKLTIPDAAQGNSHLSELFERVSNLLGGSGVGDGEYCPKCPDSLEEARLSSEDIERLALKFLLQKGSASGREISGQLKVPFALIDPLLRLWKKDQLVAFKGAAEVGDYYFVLTDPGRDRAKRYMEECTYCGSAPVALPDYLKAMEAQSIAKQEATEEDLKRAFSDLLISEKMLETLGPAVNSGRGMFLFGEPGNGKTSIAERVTTSFGSTIWIPRTLGVDGDIIRLFDPGVHEVVELEGEENSLFDLSGVDQRWVRIVRPTVIAGGELTMEELEVCQNPQTKICEAPLQLKSNCGTLVIDDFGRQTMPVEVLLNRWIVPLEKRYDFLNLPSGKKLQVPFDQLIIFSTNLEPRDLVDGAFLRRIPYKIEVPDPSEEHFRKLFDIMAPILGMVNNPEAVDYLIEKHYKPVNRPYRACQPRDLLLQIRNYCIYRKIPKKITPEGFDFAVSIYFAVM
ncbi:MAG: AAA family ATPase [Planctomycetaceae bacterium]|nr:AAA family ATPase [Planctomycetaceae bacterium]